MLCCVMVRYVSVCYVMLCYVGVSPLPPHVPGAVIWRSFPSCSAIQILAPSIPVTHKPTDLKTIFAQSLHKKFTQAADLKLNVAMLVLKGVSHTVRSEPNYFYTVFGCSFKINIW